MINRILIRIKVVQMLYSYLLTRSDFKVYSAPENPSADKRFAYAVYVDLLLMLLEFGGRSARKTSRKSALLVDNKLAKSKVAAAFIADNTVKAMIVDGNSHLDTLYPVLQTLADKIMASSAFTDFKKRRSPSLAQEVAFWRTVFESVVARDKSLLSALRSVEGFSSVGFNSGMQMFLDTLDSYCNASDGYASACNDLQRSLDLAYSLYLSFFGLIVELTREQERRLDAAKNKYLATADDLNPNLRFVNNKFALKLADMPEIQDIINKSPINWSTEITLVNSLLDQIMASDVYKEYMMMPDSDFVADCEFWRELLRSVVFVSDSLVEALENASVFWNDDLQIMGTFVLKSIRQAANNPDADFVFLEKYKDDEDAAFGADLFVDVVKNRELYRSYIDKFVNSDSWDPERIAFMDIVIMLTAISELINFPNIPLAVTMNEYVEIANDYSAPKSGQFVNGILFNVVSMLRSEGLVMK